MRWRRIQGLGHDAVIGIPGQPLFPGDVIAFAVRLGIAERTDKGTSHVVSMAGHPKRRAVARDDDRQALAHRLDHGRLIEGDIREIPQDNPLHFKYEIPAVLGFHGLL